MKNFMLFFSNSHGIVIGLKYENIMLPNMIVFSMMPCHTDIGLTLRMSVILMLMVIFFFD